MTSIGRIAFAGATAVLDSTQALANLNFDFSIVKVEAPHEFHELGKLLTRDRRDSAEDGSLHVTARRLGAVFEAILPPTPELIKCYGLRASEIAKACAEESSNGLGFFAPQAGIDGTSIWAGATSGAGAIQVHLLACILARMWTGPEATSIWVELLKCRKMEIHTEFERTGKMDLKTIAASRQDIDRDQLAQWDGSARAWLRIADNSRTLQQKQLLLIIGNMESSVNTKPALYDSVIKAWTTGLAGMEALLQGSPMVMQSGDMSLALASWHLYPDLNILDSTTKIVRQNDPLVPPSGILTLGLHRPNDDMEEQGLRWSLPLAHLRFYGDPVQRNSIVTSEGARLTLLEFGMSVLGCVLGGWDVNDKEIESVLQWIAKLSSTIDELYRGTPKSRGNSSWLNALGNTSRTFLASKGVERRIFTQLINLGRRNHTFLETPTEPYFGLADVNVAVTVARDPEVGIEILRSQTALTKLSPKEVVIRYKTETSQWEEYATALPYARKAPKRSASEESKSNTTHTRWIQRTSTVPTLRHQQTTNRFQMEDEYTEIPIDGQSTGPVLTSGMHYEDAERFNTLRDRYVAKGEGVLCVEDEPFVTVQRAGSPIRVIWGHLAMNPHSAVDAYDHWWGETKHYQFWMGNINTAALFIRMDLAEPLGLTQLPFGRLKAMFDNDEFDHERLVRHLTTALSSSMSAYAFSLQAYGTMNLIYNRLSQATIDVRILGQPISHSRWFLALFGGKRQESREAPAATERTGRRAFENRTGAENFDAVDQEGLHAFESSFFDDALHDDDEPFPNDPVEDTPLPQNISDQVESLQRVLRSENLSTAQTFSCILFFENKFDVLPTKLENVMAISSGNSLFIAASLLSDPARADHRFKVKHVLGNVGRPGVALLVPPIEPRMMTLGIDRWHLLNFSAWDGIARDSFRNSSLHLWFTGSTQEVDIGYSGAQDKELYMLESVVSLHGRGEWIADLDILKALQHQSAFSCHRQSGKLLHVLDSSTPSAAVRPESSRLWSCGFEHDREYSYDRMPLATIENWAELLTRDEQDCIVLAAGNWQARLAAMMVCISQGRTGCLVMDPVCWSCLGAKKSNTGAGDPQVYIY